MSALLLVSLGAAPGLAQTAPSPAPAQAEAAADAQPSVLTLFKTVAAWRSEQIDANHVRYTGQAEIDAGTTKFFADLVDVYTDTGRLVASGNVVFAGAEGRLAAERVEFDLRNNTGIFYEASGVMSLGATADRAAFAGQDPDVLFYGERIEKLSDRSYRISRGGFTTCVQPTPRWEVASDSVTINLNDYAVARNMVLRVKGVPLMYLPVIYYPLQEDERATGFLMPTYGSSLVRGQAISNAFFWAMSRSQDATFFHDWFTRSGQGMGAEYRYVADAASQGNVRLYRFSQKEAEYSNRGVVTTLPENQSFELSGTAVHRIGTSTRARARLDYFSDIITQQLYAQDLYRSSRTSRLLEGGISSTLGPLATSALYQRTEAFSDTRSSIVYGSTPRLSASLSPQRLGPMYASVNGEFAYLPYQRVTIDEDTNERLITQDRSLSRTDVSPTLRVPMSRLTYLSVNSSATYRTTLYSRRFDEQQQVVPESYLRQYVVLRSDIVGPVFNKIWDTPGSSFSERMKHVIEPAFAVDYTTNIENVRQTPLLSDQSDFVVSGATRFTYALTNRLFYRGVPVNGLRGQTREFVTIGLQQSYYSNPQSSQFDTTYASSSSSRRAVQLSPIALNVRVNPTATLDATARAEYDVSGAGLQVLTVGASLTGAQATAGVNYSRRRLRRDSSPDDFLTSTTSLRMLEGRVTATYGLSWNIARAYIQSQSAMLGYMAQCCGFQVDFQNYSYPKTSGFPIPADRRINFSFVLAGLGTFSNFFGAFGQR
ncbi:MAG: LPS-assembly protein LptD [Vicinamibacterales bacterium]